MSLPLPVPNEAPRFRAIRAEEVEPAIDALLAESRAALEALLAGCETVTWGSLVVPLEAILDRLDRAWGPVGHLHAVMNSEELRAAYTACVPKISAFHTDLGQNEALYRAYRALRDGPAWEGLDTAQRKLVEDALRDFHLSGVDLPPERKERFKEVRQALATLGTRFEQNLLDATQGWEKLLTDEAQLAGLPQTARAMLAQNAARKERQGWLVNLEFPSYYAVMTYAESRELRAELYQAYVTRASELGPNAGRWDNGEVMEQILQLRHEMAGLLGFPDFTAYSLATKMAEDAAEVLGFLTDLARRSRAVAAEELAEIAAFARSQGGPEELAAWDVGFWAERLKREKFSVSQEELRPYFPIGQVLEGLFAVVGRLFGVRVRPGAGFETWHDDVQVFELFDAGRETPRGRFYLDLYARPHKRGGAWVDECARRRRLPDGGIQIPVAFVTCNFAPPTDARPALLTHDELETLFHEFGHALHHMLSTVDWAAVSGFNGVPWDAVELPSQFMENFCWERSALDLLAAHFESGEPLPQLLFERMLSAKHFQAGMQMVRQLEFALFDFRLHRDYDPARGGRIQETLDAVRREVAVVPIPEFNRFQHGFSHIFAGGYAAGYYSYKWAEVLSADAFSRFEEEGVFNEATGRDFLHHILEPGGSRPPMELFVAFRGRKPAVDALLRHNGLLTAG